MKKFALIALLGVFGLSANAQGLDLGIKAGVNFSTLTDATGLDNRTGFGAGSFATGTLNYKLGLQG